MKISVWHLEKLIKSSDFRKDEVFQRLDIRCVKENIVTLTREQAEELLKIFSIHEVSEILVGNSKRIAGQIILGVL